MPSQIRWNVKGESRPSTLTDRYALFLIPSQIIITHVRPSLWLPALEFGWGILTLFMYAVKDAKQVYAIRAFVSVFQAYSKQSILRAST